MEIQDFKIDTNTALMTLVIDCGQGYANTAEFMQWMADNRHAHHFIKWCDRLVPLNGKALSAQQLLAHYGHARLLYYIQEWVHDAADVEWHIQEQHEQVHYAVVLNAEDKKYRLGRMKAMREAILWTLRLRDGKQCTTLVNRSLQNGTIRVGDEVQVKGELKKTKYGLQIKAKSISRKA